MVIRNLAVLPLPTLHPKLKVFKNFKELSGEKFSLGNDRQLSALDCKRGEERKGVQFQGRMN